MCGIAGVFGGADAPRAVRRVADALAHRGPDDAGVEAVADLAGTPCGALAHRRLAIIDLSPAGHQPMTSADGRWVIAFNGEIFNYAALRDALAAEGARFHGGSDTEVILEGVSRHGIDYAARLRGMYAIILWDRQEGAAHLLRDPFGIKPLYVAEADGRVVAASEVRAVLGSGAVPRRVSSAAVRGFLEWGAVPEPLTIADGVRALPAGSHLRVDVRDGRARLGTPRSVGAMWTPRGAPVRDRHEALAMVREALADSVRHHLVADVPVALFLSGGIDSSAVVALASRASSRPLDTFTITFDERQYDEARFARRVAEQFSTRHHEIRLTGDDLFAALPDAFAAMDQPSVDGLNTYAVSRAVRHHGLKVVLSGLGGDELFAGYPAFRRAARMGPFGPALGATPPAARRAGARMAERLGGAGGKLALLLGADDVASGAYHASRALFTGTMLDALHPPRATPGLCVPPARLSPLQTVSWHELTGYMRNMLLRDSDVFSMAHALELRVPFVDPVVATAAMGVHDALKLERGRSKPLLVDALGDLLPREVWDRPKQGFALPFERWMRGPLRDEVADALRAPERLARVAIAPAAARQVWEGFESGRAGLTWSRAWALYTLVRWSEEMDVVVGGDAAAARELAGVA